MYFIKPWLFILLAFSLSPDIYAKNKIDNVIASETYQIGLMVETLQSALQIRDNNSFETIRLYGTDSRYYPMIRGWLFQELVAVESQLYASKKEKDVLRFQLHSNFLKKAIRAIDLE